MSNKGYAIYIIVLIFLVSGVFLTFRKLGRSNQIEQNFCHPFVRVDCFAHNNKHFVVCTSQNGYEIKELK